MMPASDVDVLMIGHFAKDRLVVDGHAAVLGSAEPRSPRGGRGEVASGGGVYYGSIVLRRLGLRVAVATRLHRRDFSRLEELEQAGVQVLATAAPETSGIENVYDSADMERRVCKPLGFAGPFRSQDIPDLRARIIAVVPIIAGEVDLALLRWLAQRGPVALDVQGFVRVREDGDLVFRQWPEMAEGLSLVTYLKVDRAEAELLTATPRCSAPPSHARRVAGETDLRLAVARLAGYGPREVILTQSSGLTVFADGCFHQAPFTPRRLDGRTGRGDTCFATYLGRRLSASPQEATRLAAAVTTLKQEAPGPWRGTLVDAERLMRSRDEGS